MSVGPVERDEATAEFFDAAAAGKFLLRRCPAGHYSEPPAALCTTCGSTQLSWAAAAGGATLVSWAVTEGKHGQAGEPAATVLVIGEFDEGPWWWSQLLDADPAQLTAGARLVVAFVPGGSETVPVFRLA
jgi:uncharacterized protein